MALHFLDQALLLRLVHRFHGAERLEVVAVVLRRLQQRLDVFREATAAVAHAGKQERGTDPAIAANRLAHLIDVSTDQLAHVGNLVHEGDARGKNRVRGIFAQLGAGRIHHQNRRAGPRKRRIQLFHDRHRALVARIGTDYDPVRFHEVFDRGALLQELRIACHAERLRRLAGDRVAHPFRGADRHRALVDDDRVFVHRPADVAGHGEHVLQVRGTIFALRRSHGNEDDFRGAHGAG